MFLLKSWRLARRGGDETESEAAGFVERRAEARRQVFQEAVLALEDYYKIRAVITDLSSRGAGVQHSTRLDLPFRIRLAAPTLKLCCWARVVWQRDGCAGLEFLSGEAALD